MTFLKFFTIFCVLKKRFRGLNDFIILFYASFYFNELITFSVASWDEWRRRITIFANKVIMQPELFMYLLFIFQLNFIQ